MSNRLKHTTSPYLLQHANNPVNWHPWDDEALQLAKNDDRPILLSIGYSACHWCHVMERESFENSVIAKTMNDNFVCVKVDREERPDLDKIYQLAHQMLTQRPGGWPLTIALTPKGHAPFFAGTYFPAEPRFGMPGFKSILEQVATHYKDNRDQLFSYHESFGKALDSLNPTGAGEQIPDACLLLTESANTLNQQFDKTYGGFGSAPKFPHPTQLELLFLGVNDPQPTLAENCREMALTTLYQMANGGLFDQLFGGFFRYSVDRQWTIPHFEKMLYDNAQLLLLYCDAFTLSGQQSFYRRIITAVCDWILAEMQQDEGGYFSTLDADSEGVEGKYYVWNETDLQALLSTSQYQLFENYYALFGEPNFEGNWHLNVNPNLNNRILESNSTDCSQIQEAKDILMQVRHTRIRPALDNKILTTWNGLMIKGMARAARCLNSTCYLASARRATDFIRNNLWARNRFMACCSQGKSKLNGYLDDYTFMLEGLLEMLQTSWTNSDLEFAVHICESILENFEDSKKGGFFFSSHDHESLLCRLKLGSDDAIPSGNASAILGLLKLGTLIGEPRYLNSADRALRLFSAELQRQPSVNALMTTALQHYARGSTVIIRAREDVMDSWKEKVSSQYFPLACIFYIDSSLRPLPANLAQKKPEGEGVAYLCSGMQCSAPIHSAQALLNELHSLYGQSTTVP